MQKHFFTQPKMLSKKFDPKNLLNNILIFPKPYKIAQKAQNANSRVFLPKKNIKFGIYFTNARPILYKHWSYGCIFLKSVHGLG